jgi:hypothetical protein
VGAQRYRVTASSCQPVLATLCSFLTVHESLNARVSANRSVCTFMSTWKSILLKAFGFGAGFALTLSLIGGLWAWRDSWPKPPKPWNKQAITAEYDYVLPEGDKDNLVFRYILQNNTDFDYRVDSDAGINIANKMKRENGLGTFASHYITSEYPIFVPAKSRASVSLRIPYPYPIKEKEDPTSDERKQYRTDVAQFVTHKLSNLDGFALFDTSNRFEIDFPNGWEQLAKQGSATK